MSDTNANSADERRAFLKGTFLAAGTAVAATAAAAGTASAEQAGKLASDPMPGRSVALAVKPGIQARSIHAALDRLFEISGCPTCGLNGILDLRINVVNPAISERFSKEGIVGASENLGRF